ncbi:hypothetical protein [Sphaerotilus sp.]|uniref:hypothetical protein n=1 Tax=Sphaerotilus sp. TaxID=2093942 RepID=UPI002ACE25A2|nr:hypothetical protein [Sphaerotilus sp.]MDZ7855740.1 hypothetical protein [Sphaerotilus sp.]
MTRRVANQPATLKPIVSASELARMGLCERMVVLEHRFGQRLSVAGLAATARGRRAHARFLREGKRAPGDEPLRPAGHVCNARGFVAKLRSAWRYLRSQGRWLRMLFRVR